jgi:hypothetical protein
LSDIGTNPDRPSYPLMLSTLISAGEVENGLASLYQANAVVGANQFHASTPVA